MNCHHASCVLCAESEALGIHERASVWHHASGIILISVHGTYSEPRICHDGNAGLRGLTTYPSGGSALTSGCSSIKALVRHLAGAQQQEKSLSPPSPATLVARLGCMAQAPARECCITSPFCLFPQSFLSFSPLLFLGFINSQRDIQQAGLCQHFVV